MSRFAWDLYLQPAVEPVSVSVPGKELAVIERLPSELDVRDVPSLALRRFEDKVHRVLSEIVEDVREDRGHAFSEQYRSVMRRRLERAVERLEGGS